MKVYRASSVSREISEDAEKPLDAVATHCTGCGRIWVLEPQQEPGTCPACHQDLHPEGRQLLIGRELQLGGEKEARVSRDADLSKILGTFQALIDQTKCSCRKGYLCHHCKAKDLLSSFPESSGGTLEDSWDLLRPKTTRAKKPKVELPSRQKRLIRDLTDIEDIADCYVDTEEY